MQRELIACTIFKVDVYVRDLTLDQQHSKCPIRLPHLSQIDPTAYVLT